MTNKQNNREIEQGEIEQKDHFIIELDEHDIEELVSFNNERRIETDQFVATVHPPDEIDNNTKVHIIERLVRKLL